MILRAWQSPIVVDGALKRYNQYCLTKLLHGNALEPKGEKFDDPVNADPTRKGETWTPLESCLASHLLPPAKALLAAGAKLRESTIVRTIEECFMESYWYVPFSWSQAVLDTLDLIIEASQPEHHYEVWKCIMSKVISFGNDVMENHRGERLKDVTDKLGYSPDLEREDNYLSAQDKSETARMARHLRWKGITDVVRHLLSKGYCPMICCRLGERIWSAPFLQACLTSNFHTIELMLRTKPGPEPKTLSVLDQAHIAQTVALAAGDVDVMRVILEAQKFTQITIDELREALEQGPKCLPAFDTILQHHPDFFSKCVKPRMGHHLLNEMLRRTCKLPATNLIKKILKSGASVNHFHEHETPLSLAIDAGCEEAAQTLLEAGADALLVEHEGEVEEPEVAKHIKHRGVSARTFDTALAEAVRTGKAAFVAMIFEHHPNLLCTDFRAKQHRFLHLATEDNRLDFTSIVTWAPSDRVISQLIRNGADATVLDVHGYSPLLQLLVWCVEELPEPGFALNCDPSQPEPWHLYVPRLIRLLWHPDLDQDLGITRESTYKMGKETWSIFSCLRTMLDWSSDTDPLKSELASALAKTVRLIRSDDAGRMWFALEPGPA